MYKYTLIILLMLISSVAIFGDASLGADVQDERQEVVLSETLMDDFEIEVTEIQLRLEDNGDTLVMNTIEPKESKVTNTVVSNKLDTNT